MLCEKSDMIDKQIQQQMVTQSQLIDNKNCDRVNICVEFTYLAYFQLHHRHLCSVHLRNRCAAPVRSARSGPGAAFHAHNYVFNLTAGVRFVRLAESLQCVP